MTYQPHQREDATLKVAQWRCHECHGLGDVFAAGDKRRISWPCPTCRGTGSLPAAPSQVDQPEVRMNFPELPDLAVNLDSHAWDELQATKRCHAAFICSYGVVGDKHLYTAEQMLAYGAAIREWAAKKAESDEFYGNATQHLIAAAIREGKQ